MKFLETLYRYLLVLTKRLSNRQLMLLLGAVVGLLAGFGTYVFEMLLYWIKQGLVSWFPVESASFLFLIYPVIGIILASLFVKYVVKDNISEGVTRVLYAMSKKGSRIRPHNCYTSIIGGATTIGFGGSVGPEAPIVLTGAAIGSNVASFMRMNYRNTTLLLGCGAAGALSAIFKAPISGVVFVLEILMLDITAGSIIPLIISAVTATSLVFFLNGFDPILAVDVNHTFALKNLPMYVALGVVCGLLSYYFKAVNARVGAFFGRISSPYRKWLVGGVILGVLIFVFPPLYGEGYEAFTDLMHGNTETLFNNSLFYRFRDVPWVVILYLLAILFFKVIAMAATNAAGGVGGTFAPSLFVGAFAGGAMAYICNSMLGMDLPLVSFTLVGMAGVMSGVMNAPLTSIFLIAELSNGYGIFVPLMLASSISFAIGYYFDPYSIYTKKLHQQGELLTHNKDRSVMVFLNLQKLMETDFYPIGERTTLGDLVKLISSVRRNIFPVVSDDGTLKGVVQLDDLRADMFNSDKYGLPVTHYMIPPPDTILPNEQVLAVLDRFEESKAWMLPVVDKNGKYLGFISKSRILAAYREQLVAISEE
ncbi:chloride channel protein [Gallalistipes aquisgranensis]|uniref:chloride channel protein n=1 Tax=Gallalistipes aquisgranensis TaxID=2779358 RepID=UPI001CF7F3BF|nr:chloride channel protein [Gallalistipes aquisgranensis]MBE5032367.1 chloride channel protein [Gallalistipes aquisgranensis]